MSSIIKKSVWATRKKLDGRCDYRKRKGNPSKRSLSPQGAGREILATGTCAESPYWLKSQRTEASSKSSERGCCGYATAVVTSSLNFKAGECYV